MMPVRIIDAPRVLLVDDSRTMHEDYRRLLAAAELSPEQAELQRQEVELFGDAGASGGSRFWPKLDLVSCYSGDEAVATTARAMSENRPFEVAFVDVRMPPGIDGVQTVEEMWKIDPRIEIVLCSAYSDHTWSQIVSRLGRTHRLLILKKPFDAIEVRQLALALTTKWKTARDAEILSAETDRLMAALRDELLGFKRAA